MPDFSSGEREREREREGGGQKEGRLARARARAPSELDRFSMKAGQFREIIGRFLLNELGDPHF